MPLHLTKVAFGADSVDHLAERLLLRGEEGPVFLTTRYLPKRHEEVAGPILGFGEAEGGRVAIHIDPKLVLVQARPKRAHQGWRYLEGADAPLDLGGDATGLDIMPPALMTKLAELALI